VPRKAKIEALEKLERSVEPARQAKELQEEESWKPREDEWDNPMYDDGSSPQNPPQSATSVNSEEELSHL
jgi:hypothetical protein